MSLYNPDQAARDTWTGQAADAFRTQRDVGLLIPINFLINPTVSLRAACFGNNQYEDSAFQKCFSNLLSVGFRKFIVDVYWDAGRLEWGLCPAEIPPTSSTSPVSTPTPETPGGSATSPSPSSSPTTESSSPDAKRAEPTTEQDRSRGVEPRQDEPTSTTSSTPSSTPSPTPSNNSPTPTPSPTAPQLVNNNQVFSIGQYNCTSTITLRFLTGIFEAFLDETATTTDATLSFLLLNIHAASSWAQPDDPAREPPSDRLPGPNNLLSDIVRGNLTEELYTVDDLQNDRVNLGGSWLKVNPDILPAKGYYTTSQDPSGHRSSPDGWPTEAWLEFQQLLRASAVFGNIDPQMSAYNTTADAGTIFPKSTVRLETNISLNTNGTLSSGCLFSASDTSITPSTNSSWALAAVPNLDISRTPNPYIPIPSITNITSCGLSPLLNTSLASTSADKSPLPYAAFVQSTLWSWAPGQPTNASTTSDRCAVMHIAQPYPGRWFVADCNARHRVACHDPNTPYNWTLSPSTSRYVDAEKACPSPLAFSVPHTALENAHLFSSASSSLSASSHDSSSSSKSANEPIFINLNSLDVDNCWVTTINGTCPYRGTPGTDPTRVVVVPTVAAVIVFVLAALTFFVKCAANRREDKRGRRRRMVGGWEYEGVPS